MEVMSQRTGLLCSGMGDVIVGGNEDDWDGGMQRMTRVGAM